MMAHSTDFELLNVTTNKLTYSSSSSHEYQMTNWQFSNVAPKNYTTFYVEFFSGHNDEDDGAEAYYTISDSSGNQFVIQGRSTNDSAHYLQVECQSGTTAYVLAIPDTTSGVITSSQQGIIEVLNSGNFHAINWYPYNANTTYKIGTVEGDGTTLGFGIIDLTLLFPNNGQTVSSYQTKITNGTLTLDDQNALGSALAILIPAPAMP